MPLTASKLRQNIYKILDSVIETGRPIELERNGAILKIVPEKMSMGKLSRLKKRKLTDEDSGNFESIDWTEEWTPK